MTSRDRTPLMPTLLFTSLLESGYPKVASTGSWWRRRWLCERTGTQPHSQHKRPSPPRHQPALTGGDLSPHSAVRQPATHPRMAAWHSRESYRGRIRSDEGPLIVAYLAWRGGSNGHASWYFFVPRVAALPAAS